PLALVGRHQPAADAGLRAGGGAQPGNAAAPLAREGPSEFPRTGRRARGRASPAPGTADARVATPGFAGLRERASPSPTRFQSYHSDGRDDEIPSRPAAGASPDRKSTRLNSSHDQISYAV